MRWMTAVAAAILMTVPATADDGGPDLGATEQVTVLSDVAFPSDIEVAPDGTVWFVETYDGNVKRLAPGSEEPETMHSADVVGLGDERGLVGLALAHDHDATGAFYIYYTSPEGAKNGTNRLVRVEDGRETLLTTVPAAPEHNGGRIVVEPDGDLFVATGENQLRDPAQDLDSLLGKVLHMTPDGGPAEGNMQGLVYSYGHRNPYGLALAEDGRLWSTENSGWRRDEINVIEPGNNYGYPECEGHGLNGVDTPCPTDKGYTFPAMTFYEDRATAPTGAAFWQGSFFWASLREGAIHHMWQQDGRFQDEVVHVHDTEEPVAILDVAAGPAGLYYSTIDGIYALQVPGADIRPAVGSGTTTASDASPGLPVVLVLMAMVFVLWRHRR